MRMPPELPASSNPWSTPSAKWALSTRPGPCSGSIKRTALIARVALGQVPTVAGASRNFAKMAPRPWPTKEPRSVSLRNFLHATLSRVAEAKRLLAWAPDVADDSGRGVRSLPADHLGCGVRVDWKNTELLAVSEPCRVLHFRQDEQRGSLPVSAFRPGNLGRTIYPIVPKRATNQAAAPC